MSTLSLLRDTHAARALARLVPGAVTRGPRRDAEGRPLLYVTIDDGPDAEGTPRLLDTLGASGAHAVAFLSADRALALPHLARAWTAGGHRAGNHGGAHRSAWREAPGWAAREMDRAERALTAVTGADVRDVRPPYGRVTPGLVRWARRGRRVVLWDALPGDYLPHVSPDALARRIVRLARPGGVVVLHDGPPAARAAEALRLALPRLAAAGWRFPALPAAS